MVACSVRVAANSIRGELWPLWPALDVLPMLRLLESGPDGGGGRAEQLEDQQQLLLLDRLAIPKLLARE